jgi:hypothetical protein
VHLEFDVDEALGPRIGIVLAPANAAGWVDLLAALVSHGLCTPAKRDALLVWPGDTDGTSRALRRTLSHVKLSAAPSGGLEAKAYITGAPIRTAA